MVSAFTATATAAVQEDIVTQLGLQDPVTVVTGFDRPNLFFDVLRPEKKGPVLLDLVEKRRGQSGIVYCATRAGVEKVCALLCRQGIPATPVPRRPAPRTSAGKTRRTSSLTASR